MKKLLLKHCSFALLSFVLLSFALLSYGGVAVPQATVPVQKNEKTETPDNQAQAPSAEPVSQNAPAAGLETGMPSPDAPPPTAAEQEAASVRQGPETTPGATPETTPGATPEAPASSQSTPAGTPQPPVVMKEDATTRDGQSKKEPAIAPDSDNAPSPSKQPVAERARPESGSESELFIKNFTGGDATTEWENAVYIKNSLNDSGFPLKLRISLYLKSQCGARAYQYAVNSNLKNELIVTYSCENSCEGVITDQLNKLKLPEEFCYRLWKLSPYVHEVGL